MARIITCCACGVTYEASSDWNDDKAQAELERNFPERKNDKLVVLCDGCYQKVLDHHKIVPPAMH